MRPRPPGRPRTPAAFTLLEVMVVVGMAALVMGISVPFVQKTIRRDVVYQAVHAVEEGCRNARATAILRNTTAELVIRPQDGSLSVQAGAAPVAPPRASDDPAGDGEAPRVQGFAGLAPKPFAGQLPDDVVIELLDVNFEEFRDEEEARVRFHPNGTSDEFTIVMRIGATAWRKITLDLVTGIPTLEVMR